MPNPPNKKTTLRIKNETPPTPPLSSLLPTAS
jgi:hypothetical protein